MRYRRPLLASSSSTASLVAVASFLAAVVCVATISHAQPVDVNPDGLPGEPRFGGRSLGLTIHPLAANVVYVASERGGFFRSVDGGNRWHRVDAIPVPMGRDILFDPRDGSVLIASGRYDGRVNNQGGIWRSGDGGVTWAKPPTSNPACNAEASTWGIAIANHPVLHSNVYVATDCGIAISTDAGLTWTHADPCTNADAAFCGNRPYFDVAARVVGGNVQLDVCGDEGYFRSTDGGATWSAPDPASPARSVSGGAFNPCRIDTAPADSNTVYLANYSGTTPSGFCAARLMENAAGGAAGSWVDMQIGGSNCRDPWVVTHPDLAGNASRFHVYFGDATRMRVQRCDLANTPRCAPLIGNWPRGDMGAHADTSDVAFDPATPNGCPLVLSNDGGIATSGDCGANWQDGNRGLHALDVVTFAGTDNGGAGTELYAGTQDNGIYVSQNSAASWSRPVGADGYNVLADRVPPARVFYRRCFGCSDFIADPGLSGAAPFSDPPGNIPTFARATQFGPRSYAFVTNDGGSPALWTAWVTTDEGASWNQLGPSPLPGNPGEIKAAGPAANPTFFLRLNVGGPIRIFRLSGALDSTATLALANAGLSRPSSAWDVDPSDPTRLYAADVVLGRMMSSLDGGVSWQPDFALTALITGNGTFRFQPNSFSSLVSGVAFDPNTPRIFVGTRTNGLFVSVTDGQTWLPVADSQDIPRAEELFFDPDGNVAYAATRGRGIWRIVLPEPQIQVPGNLDLGDACVGEQGVGTLDVCNTGVDDLVVQAITSSSPRFAVTEPLGGGYPVTLVNGACFPFQVTFDPVAPGPQSGTLTVSSNDLETPNVAVAVAAAGTEPDIRVTGSTDFGVASAWSPAERTVEICNVGACDLAVSGATIDCADFVFASNPLPTALPPGACIDLVVAFEPALYGKKSCQLTINSDDADTPVVNRPLVGRTPPLLSLHAGLVEPHGTLSNTVSHGSTVRVGFLYPLKPKMAWRVDLGTARFDGRPGFDDIEVWSLDASFRFTVNPAMPARFFLTGGLGVWHFDPGDFEGGIDLGLGVTVPVGPRFAFEATYDYRFTFTASPSLRYSRLQAGFLVSF